MFNQFQQEAARSFKPAESAKEALLDWCLGLGGETGEVLDLVKHNVFHHENSDKYKMELAKELGDILWYVAAIATTEEIFLEDIVTLNVEKLNHRYGGEYSDQASLNRHKVENKFSDTAIYKILKSKINREALAPLNVIVIGPDGAGKTTLIQKLSESLKMPVVKCDYRQEDKIGLSYEYLNNNINVIYDRFYFPDDMVYCKAKGIPLDDEKLAAYGKVLELMKKRNVVFVYVDAPLEMLVERSKAWADDYVSTDDLINIKRAYGDIINIFLRPNGQAIINVENTSPIESEEYKAMIKDIETLLYNYAYDWARRGQFQKIQEEE